MSDNGEKPVSTVPGDPSDASHFELEPGVPLPGPTIVPVLPAQPDGKPSNPTVAANAAIVAADAAAEAPPPIGPPIIPSTRALARPLLFVGLGLLLAATIAAVVNAEKHHVAHVVRAIYDTVLHSALGVLAAYALAKIERRELGDWREAWSRTFVAVAALEFVLHLNFGLTTTKVEEALAGACVYFLAMIFLMKWSAVRVLHLAALQFAAWAVLEVSTIIHTWATSVAG